jgi:hypothetical protein
MSQFYFHVGESSMSHVFPLSLDTQFLDALDWVQPFVSIGLKRILCSTFLHLVASSWCAQAPLSLVDSMGFSKSNSVLIMELEEVGSSKGCELTLFVPSHSRNSGHTSDDHMAMTLQVEHDPSQTNKSVFDRVSWNVQKKLKLKQVVTQVYQINVAKKSKKIRKKKRNDLKRKITKATSLTEVLG